MITVKQAIEILKTLPQDAQLMVDRTDDCGCLYGPSEATSIHTKVILSQYKETPTTVVIVDDNDPQ